MGGGGGEWKKCFEKSEGQICGGSRNLSFQGEKGRGADGGGDPIKKNKRKGEKRLGVSLQQKKKKNLEKKCFLSTQGEMECTQSKGEFQKEGKNHSSETAGKGKRG